MHESESSRGSMLRKSLSLNLKIGAVGTVICVRRLRKIVAGRETIAILKIGKPRREGGDWVCPFHISQVGMVGVTNVYGVDALQALILALEGIRATLDRAGGGWSWSCGEEGDTGIPQFVPMGFGRAFSSKLESYIGAAVEKHASAGRKVVSRRHRRRV